jgi:hypothetical protein
MKSQELQVFLSDVRWVTVLSRTLNVCHLQTFWKTQKERIGETSKRKQLLATEKSFEYLSLLYSLLPLALH